MIYENEYEALRVTIEKSGKSYKEVAGFIFSHLKPPSAYSRLMNSLTPSKDEKLSFRQIIDMCIFCQRFDALFYIANECGFERPKVLKIEDVEKEIITNLNKIKKEFEGIFNTLEKIYLKK